MNKSIIDQKKRYDAEAIQHSEHYNDKYTQMYRDEFIRKSRCSIQEATDVKNELTSNIKKFKF